MDSARLLELAGWVRDHPLPLFSLLVSRHGRLVFELYTSGIEPDAAHYLMSVTKTVTSALYGIAVHDRNAPPPDTQVADALPADVFPTPSDRERFRSVTLRDVMAMSALDTPDPPRIHTPEATARHRAFLAADNRARFVLAQPVLPHPGVDYLYNDEGPQLVTAALSYRTGQTAFDLAEELLFRPLGFRHEEWMHQDPSGLDNGGYGLRLRPVDMQKLGLLFLRRGAWNGRQLVPAAWVDTSFTPWMRTDPSLARPNYGWFWWTNTYGPGWLTRSASGWKGQFIVVVPEQDLVVTMTACFEDGHEKSTLDLLMKRFVIPAVLPANATPRVASTTITDALRTTLAAVHASDRLAAGIEPRMVPSVAPKERRRPLRR